MRRTVEEAAATRQALLRAALPVFGARGYAAATLDEIATCAGVTRGALYHHFAGKPELFLLVLEEGWAEAMAPLNARLEGDAPPLTRVRRFLVAYLEALEHDASLRMLLQMVMFPSEGFPELEQSLTVKHGAIEAWTASLASVFIEARHRGQLRTGLSPRNAALVVVSFAYGVTTTWMLCTELFSPAREAEQLTDAVLEGITA
jgi:TetR/AcrR family transcriptional regulator, acrAB operon repressor